MNILYLGDPNSIHDIRWIECFSTDKNFRVYLLPRVHHHHHYVKNNRSHKYGWMLLAPVQDSSTVRVYRTLKNAWYIRSLVKMYKIDLIHIMYAEPNALWARWISMFNIPMILTTRGTDVLKTIPDFFEKKSLLSRIVASQYKKALNRFNCITCTSQKQVQSLEKIGVKSPTQIVRTGVDFEKANAAILDMKSKLGVKKPFVLMPRNMKPLYFHEFTLDAIALLNQKIRQNYTFVFVNADTQDQVYFQEIKNKALCIEADIRFYPSFSHEEILSLYKQAELVVMNPVSDGSPVTAMEAMACRVPVVLPPLAYDQEIFCYSSTFAGWEPQALKEKMERIIGMNKEELCDELCRAYQVIYEKGDTTKEMGKVAELYQKVMANAVKK